MSKAKKIEPKLRGILNDILASVEAPAFDEGGKVIASKSACDRLRGFLSGSEPSGSDRQIDDAVALVTTPEAQEALDEIVHEHASDLAARINNNGPAAQLRWLREQGGDIGEISDLVSQ